MIISSNWGVVIILSVVLSFTSHSDDAPTPITVHVAEPVYLRCTINISEVRSVEWKHNNKRIMLHDHKNGLEKNEKGYRSSFLSEDNSYQLEIIFNGPKDLGSYVCLQYTSWGTPEKLAWILQTEVKDDGNVGNGVTATVGDTITLECSSNSSYLASVNWKKNGVGFIKHNVNLTGRLTDGKFTSRIFQSNATARLAIADLIQEDGGNYSCLLYHASGKYFKTSWTLHIKDIGPDESIKTAFIGNSVTFTCIVNTTRTNLVAAHWFHGSNQILHHDTSIKVKTKAKYTSTVDDDQSIFSLTISLVGHDDRGKYSCVPYLNDGKRRAIYWDLHVKGEQKIEKTKLILLYGYTELDCLSNLRDVVAFQWTHNHDVMEKIAITEANNDIKGEHDSSLSSFKILNATFKDAGIYACFSFSKDNKTHETSWTVQIQGIPKVTVIRNTSKENDTVNSVCCVKFGIDPVSYDIDWLLNRKRHAFNLNLEKFKNDNKTLCNSLQFSVKRAYHGQSLDCWVQNELNRTSSITLNVFYSPHILQTEHYPSAHIFPVATNAYVVCSVDAHPQPYVNLEEETTNGAFVNMLIKPELHNVNGTITDWKFLLSVSDKHSYRCVASNAYGTTASSKIEINCVLSCVFNGIKGMVLFIVIISFGIITLVIVFRKTAALLKETFSRYNIFTDSSRLQAQSNTLVSSTIYENYSGNQSSPTEERKTAVSDKKISTLVGDEDYSLVTINENYLLNNQPRQVTEISFQNDEHTAKRAEKNRQDKVRQQDKNMRRKPTPKRKSKQRESQMNTSIQNETLTASTVGDNSRDNFLYATVNKEKHIASSSGLYANVHEYKSSAADTQRKTSSDDGSQNSKMLTTAEIMYAKVKKNKIWRSEL